MGKKVKKAPKISSCPACESSSGLREIIYGYPAMYLDPSAPIIDEGKYALGGCCISDNDPTVKCIDCGWKGEFIDNMNGWKRGTKFVELADISKMSDVEIRAYAKKTWSLLTGVNIEEEDK